MHIDREQLLEAYRQMRTIREFEERLHKEFTTGQIPGFVHLYAGEETSAVAVCQQLNNEDHIARTHRGHGHCLAKGWDVLGLLKELYGRAEGLCEGRGGPMHIADLDQGTLGATGIFGGGRPSAWGPRLEIGRSSGRVRGMHP